jgi:hypothetical protein
MHEMAARVRSFRECLLARALRPMMHNTIFWRG